MTTLRVTPEVLKSLVGEMRTEIDNIKTHMQGIDREVSDTQSYWRGDASAKHVSNYQEIQPQGEALLANLNTAPVDLLKIAGIYEETEEELQATIQTLPVDVFG